MMSGGVPRYVQLAALIREMITSGELTIGDMTPSRPALSSEYRVSGATADKALDLLVREGLLERRPGIGTAVIAVPQELAEVRVGPGTRIRARLPRPAEIRAGAVSSMPVLIISRPGQPEEVLSAGRAVIVTTG
jgi:DNA-binding GntR family transcriptional regulator